VVLYTVDGAAMLPLIRGTLLGPEVLTAVDFGPNTDVEAAFALQKRYAASWAADSCGRLWALMGSWLIAGGPGVKT